MKHFSLTLLSLLMMLLHQQPLLAQVNAADAWVDSVFNKMSLEDKIGQLFIIRAHSDLGEDHIQSVVSQIKNYHVGGLCFFQGTP